MVMRPPFLLTPRNMWAQLLVPPPGAVLYLPGLPRVGSTITDYSGQGNHGTISGATWTTLGSGLPVLSFDGDNDYVDCGRDSTLDIGTEDYSLLAWINCESKVGFRHILSKGRGGAGGKRAYFYVAQTTGKLQVEIDPDVVAAKVITGATDVATSTWLLAGFSADRSGNAQLYINGVADGSAVDISAASQSVTDTGKDLCIGVDPADETSFNFDGLIALSALIIGRVVSASEYLSFYRQTRHLFGV